MDGVDGALDGDMIEFWGKELPPGGKQFSVEVLNEPPVFQVVHVTGVALGDGPKAGPHVIKVLNGDGQPIPVATLERGAAAQASLDFAISATTVFVNSGPGPVFVSGYITRSLQQFEGSDSEEGGSESSEEEDDDEDEEEELEDSDADEAPRKGAAKKRGSPFVDEEAEETSEEDDSDEEMEESEEDEDEEGDAFDRKLGAKKFDMGGSSEDGGSSDGEGESSEEDEDEDDEGEEGLPDLDSDDMIAEATDSDEEEGEEDSDEPPEEKKSTGKRPAPSATPQPAKKAKADVPKAPASAPPKVQGKDKGAKQQQQAGGGGGGGGAESAYLAAIVDVLKEEGKPLNLSVLGTRVQRPPGFKTKSKAFMLAHADKLVFDEKAQTVGLKK